MNEGAVLAQLIESNARLYRDFPADTPRTNVWPAVGIRCYISYVLVAGMRHYDQGNFRTQGVSGLMG